MHKDHNSQIDLEIYPVSLTIAGSDSGGGAGIQADLRTFSSFGVFGTSVITAVTAQNPLDVSEVSALTDKSVTAQIKAVFAQFAIKSVKTGMLHNTSIIKAVANELNKKAIPLIVDPVMVSTSGTLLLENDALEAMKNLLLPLASWITPNIKETEKLLGKKINCQDDMIDAAAECADRWDTVCVIKGGDLNPGGKNALDIVASRGRLYRLITPWAELPPEGIEGYCHGTGCTFSAALAAATALEMSWKDTIVSAKAFVYGSLTEKIKVGSRICAMYPPSGAYRDKVVFEKIK